MKKVLSALILTSLLAVLLVPATALAINDCSYLNCNGVNPTGCRCGSATTDEYHRWCTTEMAYASYEACYAAMPSGTSGGAIDTPEKLVDLINRIGGYIFNILLAIAGVFLIVAGFLFVTAGGNPENVAKARQMLINALIGVAVAVGAQGLKTIVVNLVS